MRRTKDGPLRLPHGAALDALLVVSSLKNGVDENPGRMNLIGVKLAKLDEFFDFGDDVIRRGGHHGIEVARRLAINQVAPAIALPRFNKRKVPPQSTFENILPPLKFARFFSLGNQSAVTRRRVERWNSRPARAQALRKRTLRVQLDLHLASQDQLLEKFVLTHIGRNHFLNLPLLQQHADAEIIHARIIADNGEFPCSFAPHRLDKVFRNAAKAEATHQNRGAVLQFFDRGVSRGNALVHALLQSVRGSLLHPASQREAARRTPRISAACLFQSDASLDRGAGRAPLDQSISHETTPPES